MTNAAGAPTSAIPPPTLTVTLTRKTVKNEHCLKGDKPQVIAVGIALLIALLGYANHSAVVRGHIYKVVCFDPSIVLGVVSLLMCDIFLVSLLIAVVQRCRMAEESVWPPGIPERGTAVLVLGGVFWSMVFASAMINRTMARAPGAESAGPLYEGFLLVATMEHEHFAPVTMCERFALVAELSSVILLFIVFLPLLVGRLGMFRGEGGTATVNPVEILEVKLESDARLNWKSEVVNATPAADGKSLTLKVDSQLRVRGAV